MMALVQVWAHKQRGLMLALRQANLTADSIEAVNARTTVQFGRAIYFYSQHAVQSRSQLDRLEDEYEVALSAVSNLTLELSEARSETRVVATETPEVSGGFDLRSDWDLPVGRVEVEVRAVPPPEESIFRWAYLPEPVPLEITLGCRDHKAYWTVRPPEGMEADFTNAQVDPEICNPLPPVSRQWYDRWWIGAAATGAVLQSGT